MKTRIFNSGIVITLIGFILLIPAVGRTEFPEKPIQILVGWPPGSMNDTMDRPIAAALQKILKQPVIIQNQPGGGGALICGRVKTEKPDGYTLFQTGFNIYARYPHLRKLPYTVRDFAYLAQHAWFLTGIMDHPDNPWKTFEEMVTYVKANPKKVKYTSPGVGSAEHLIMEYVGIKENLQWTHVPSAAVFECIAAVMAGHVQFASSSIGAEAEKVRAGRIRLLLITGPKRIPQFPEVPSIIEKGYDWSAQTGCTWTVPAATPKDIQQKLERALLQAFKDPTVVEVINKLNMGYEPLDSETLTKLMFKEDEINKELVIKLGFKKD
jgi:tripartite-type tricarboxylate transporter receptor subunit TctC